MVSITIQGVMAAIGLWLLGVPYFFVLGIWMAVTAILPYIGAFLGGIPAVIIALTISWQLAVVTIVLYVVINQFEGNLITPRIQGNAVRVHPVMIFIAVLLGNALGGILGAIIAVPTLAIVRVLAEFFWVRLRVRGTHDTLLAAIGGDQTTEFPPVLASADTPPQEPADSRPTARGTANRDTTGR
ncbi:MAG: AI-2E family transporter [Chloroflexota bacterium]|nr:AI-2E family transporter [Chloroflexota bacterium]